MKSKISPIYLTLIFIVVVFLSYVIFGAELETNKEIVITFGAQVGDYVEKGMIWLLVTSGFLHIEPLHLIFNLIALYQLGNIAQIFYGEHKVFTTFLYSIIVGNILSYIFFKIADINYAVSIGASGGIFGILGLLVGGTVLHRRYGMGLPFRTENFYPTLGLAILISFMPNVNWVAHLGGFIMGLVFGYFFKTTNDEQFSTHNEKVPKYFFYSAAGIFVISYALLIINLLFEIVPI